MFVRASVSVRRRSLWGRRCLAKLFPLLRVAQTAPEPKVTAATAALCTCRTGLSVEIIPNAWYIPANAAHQKGITCNKETHVSTMIRSNTGATGDRTSQGPGLHVPGTYTTRDFKQQRFYLSRANFCRGFEIHWLGRTE